MMEMWRGRMEFHLCAAIKRRRELLNIYNFEFLNEEKVFLLNRLY